MSDIFTKISDELGRLAQEQAGFIDDANQSVAEADAAALRADAAIQIGKINIIHVDPINGSDVTGIGTETLPYETIGHAATNIRSLTDVRIGLHNDTPLDETINLSGFHGAIEVETFPSNRSTRCKLLVRNLKNGSAGSGTFYVFKSRPQFTFETIDVVFESQYTGALITLFRGSAELNLTGVDLIGTASPLAFLVRRLGNGCWCDLHVGNVTHTGMDGKFFTGLAQSADPNSLYWVRSSDTQLD